MNAQIVTSLISAAGLAISILVSLIAARRAASHELRKIRRELTNIYSVKLLDVRVATYPDLYFLLSAFIMHIEGGSEKHMAGQRLTRADARDLLRGIVIWDNKNALFLSPRALDRLFDLRRRLIMLLAESPLAKDDAPLPDRSIFSLLAEAQRLELALKTDLGIFEVVPYEERTAYETYRQASEALNNPTELEDKRE